MSQLVRQVYELKDEEITIILDTLSGKIAPRVEVDVHYFDTDLTGVIAGVEKDFASYEDIGIIEVTHPTSEKGQLVRVPLRHLSIRKDDKETNTEPVSSRLRQAYILLTEIKKTIGETTDEK